MSSAAKQNRSTSRVSKKKTSAPKEGAAKKADRSHKVRHAHIVIVNGSVTYYFIVRLR